MNNGIMRANDKINEIAKCINKPLIIKANDTINEIIKYINKPRIIKATNDTISGIVDNEINKLGWDADLNHIDVSQVTNMKTLFYNSPFNGDISRWNVQNVLDMSGMFYNSSFNGDISNWNVQNVLNMSYMFFGSNFNGNISNWNVGNVQYMRGMFYRSNFNGNISNWNVINVLDILVDHLTIERTRFIFKYSPLEGREPWWYSFSPLFGSPYLMWDSLDFGWIDLEGKIIYRDKLIKTLKRSYNREWNGELPEVFGFTYN